MLDLQQAIKQAFYDIRLLDGTELHLKRPNQAMIEYIVGLESFLKDNKEVEAMNGFVEAFVSILNRNVEGVKFEADVVREEYDIAVMVIVIRDYFDYWNKDLMNRVDFQQSRQ